MGPPHKSDAGPFGKGTGVASQEISSSTSTYSPDQTKYQELVELDDLDEEIETAEAYERVLALECYRVRKLILNLKIKRENLEGLGAVLMDRRAA